MDSSHSIMARSVAVRIKPPPSPLPSSELSVQQVSDFVETKMSKANGIADVIISRRRRRRRGSGKRRKIEPLNFSLGSLDSDRDLDRSDLVYGCLQYYVNETLQQLRDAAEKQVVIEMVTVKLDHVDILLGDDDSVAESYLIKWKVEYSGDPSLIKTCSVFGCDSFLTADQANKLQGLKKEREKRLKEMKTMTVDRRHGFITYQPIINAVENDAIQSAMDPLLHWILACLRLALSFFPLVEEIVREHETVHDVIITSLSGRAQFHAGKDAILNMRRQLAATSTSTKMIVEKMMASPSLNMKVKMWSVPFLQRGIWIFPTSIFGVAAVDDDLVIKDEVDAFFDQDPEQSFSDTAEITKRTNELWVRFFGGNQLIEKGSDQVMREFNAFLEDERSSGRRCPPILKNLSSPYKYVELEMTKIMKKMPPSTAELTVTWQFNHQQDGRQGDYEFIFLNNNN